MRKKLLKFLSLFFVVMFLMGCVDGKKVSVPVSSEGKQQEQENEQEIPQIVHKDITIVAVGDLLIHSGIYKSAYNSSTGSYDFREQFKYIKPIIEKADIAVANLETTLGGEERGYSGYPLFSAPDSLIDALKDSGFDLLTGSNNHRIDTGVKGFYRTIDVVRDKGLDIIGIRRNETEKSYVIKEINGVKVALLNIGYGSTLKDGTRTLNGIPIPKELLNLIDYVDYDRIEEDIIIAEKLIEQVKQEKPHFIVAFMHWGNEYQRKPNQHQKDMAHSLSKMGVDVIFGGHPHVLQPAEVIESQGRETIVFYSLGNIISNQRKETIENIYSEQGMIASATLRYYSNGEKVILEASYMPTWVNKKKSPKLLYEIIPVEEALQNKASFSNINAQDIYRISYTKESVDELMSSMDTKAVFSGER